MGYVSLRARESIFVSLALVVAAFANLAEARPSTTAPPLAPPSGIVIHVSTEAQLQSAIAGIASNTTILIDPGVYVLTRSLYINRAVSNIAIRGASDNRDAAVLIGRGMANADYASVPYGIWTGGGVNGITIANLTIKELYFHPIIFNAGTQSPHVYNVHLINAGEQFIKVNPDPAGGGADNGSLEYSLIEFETTARDDYPKGIDIQNAQNWVIRHNEFRNIIGPGGIMAGPGILAWRGTRNTLAEGNTFINCSRGIMFGAAEADGFDHQGGVIRNNFFYRAPNVPGDVGIHVADSPGTRVLNNTVLTSGTYGYPIEYRFPDSTGLTIANNLIDGVIRQREGASATLLANEINANPSLFVDAAAGDLHLRATAAAAIDLGVALSDVLDDWDGQPRSGPVDIGADEYGGNTSGNLPPSLALSSPADGGAYPTGTPLALAAAASDADGYIARVDFYINDALTGSDATAPFEAQWSAPAPGMYTVQAVATDNLGVTTNSAVVHITAADSALPTDWGSQDIGAVGAAGNTLVTGGVWTVRGAGADIWGTADAFRFAYRSWTGDGEITARVVSQQPTNVWALAGLMWRESLAPGARHSTILLTPGNGWAFEQRPVANGASTYVGGSGNVPSWIRLRRAGSTLTAWISPDGATWTLLGSQTLSLPPTLYVGVAVSSHVQGVLGAATFDQVSVATVADGGLPSGWSNQDIGAVGAAGQTNVTGGTWTSTGAGADIWGTADAFQFAYRSWTGDGEITARVLTQQATNVWALAGVMWRESLLPGARHSALLLSPSSGWAFEQRPVTNGGSTYVGGSGSVPSWIRLRRVGSTLTAWISADGSAWTLLASQTQALPDTLYVGLAVSSHVQGVLGTATFDQVSVSAASGTALPAGWSNQDIGNVGAAGNTISVNGTWTVVGSGDNIWNSADAFQFAFRSWTGDGEITARLVAQQAVDPWALAGLMWRESLTPGSRHSAFLLSPSNGWAFEQRPGTNGPSTFVGGSGAAPSWIRLRRSGAALTAWISPDGTTWTLAGTQTLDMIGTIYVGLAVTSHLRGAVGTATFDQVTVVP